MGERRRRRRRGRGRRRKGIRKSFPYGSKIRNKKFRAVRGCGLLVGDSGAEREKGRAKAVEERERERERIAR